MSKFLKTLIVALLSFTLLFAFTGCDQNDGDDTLVTGDLTYKLYEDEDDNHKYYTVTGYTVTSDDAVKMASGDFSSFTAAQREIEIPATYNNYPVEKIAAAAFADQVILKKVVVPATINEIGEGAFSGCTNLQELTIPFVGKTADATNEERVFGHLFGSASTGEGNTQITAKIHQEETEAGTTFYVPASLKSVTVLGNRVPECAFYGMAMLQTVVVDSATYIGAFAFQGCSLISQVNVSAATAIYDGAFQLCTSLQRVTLGSSLEFIGDYAFSGCSRLGLNYASNDETLCTLTLPESVTYLGKYAFSNCLELKYVNIAATKILEVYEGTFSSCESLEKVTVNSNIYFRAGAFSKSKKLDESKIIGAGSGKFETGAFGKVELPDDTEND